MKFSSYIFVISFYTLLANGFQNSCNHAKVRKAYVSMNSSNNISDKLTCEKDNIIKIWNVILHDEDHSIWNMRNNSNDCHKANLNISDLCTCENRTTCDFIPKAKSTTCMSSQLEIRYHCIPITSSPKISFMKMFSFKGGSSGGRINVVRIINIKECQLMTTRIKEGTFCREFSGNEPNRLLSSEKEISFSMPNASVEIIANSSVNDVVLNIARLSLPKSSASLLLPSDTFSASGYQRIQLLLNESYFSVLAISDRQSKVDTTVTFKWSFDPIYIREAIHTALEQRRAELGEAKVIKVGLQCVFINVTTKEFSDNGCRKIFSLPDRQSYLHCECDHATVFTIVLTASLKTVPYSVKVVSYVTESLSIFCLVVTFFILFSVRKKIQSNRIYIQLNLILSLIIFHIISLFHDLAFLNRRGCEVAAVLLHFFILATGGWMLAEGTTLHAIVSGKALEFLRKYKKPLFYFNYSVGYLIPALITSVSAVIGFNNSSYLEEYSSNNVWLQNYTLTNPTYDLCWLNSVSGMRLYAVMVPLAVVLLLNIFFAVNASSVIVIIKTREKRELSPVKSQFKFGKLQQIHSGLKTLLLLFPALGLPWIFRYFVESTEETTTLAFLHINAVINGLQGALIFLVFVIFNSQVKEAFKFLLKLKFPRCFEHNNKR